MPTVFQATNQAGADSLALQPFPEDGGNTVLHYLATGESLGLGGCLLAALARHRGSAGTWPSRHQRRRTQLLAYLLTSQPRLALLASWRNAEGQTPLHAAVLSDSLQVLALLLAALQLLLGPDSPTGGQKQVGQQQGQRQRRPQWPLAGVDTAATLHLLLCVPDSSGLTPLELAVQRRQWPAVRLLAAAAGGALPLSLAQLEACSLVQRSLGGGGGFARGSLGGSSVGSSSSRSGSEGMHIQANGSTVTEALGGLLSKLWDAFGGAGADLGGSSRGGGSASQRSRGIVDGSDVVTRLAELPALLRLQPVSQDQVMEMVQAEEQHASQAPASATAGALVGSHPQAGGDPGAACHPAVAPAASLLRCIVCFEDFPPGWVNVRLPCGHVTCDACWRGILLAAIDEGGFECSSPVHGTGWAGYPHSMGTWMGCLPAPGLLDDRWRWPKVHLVTA
jgi:hypothetical protein